MLKNIENLRNQFKVGSVTGNVLRCHNYGGVNIGFSLTCRRCLLQNGMVV